MGVEGRTSGNSIPSVEGNISGTSKLEAEGRTSELSKNETEIIYHELQKASTEKLPSYDLFSLAYKGYLNLKSSKAIRKNILSIIDFSLASNERRLWVIDLDKGKILFYDWVAHGKNSGDNYALKFSNTPNTNMSSIGYFITGETYSGKHGLSLFIDGKDEHYNQNARKRAIVIHGADYVSEEFITKYGRLGRSFGCPSLRMDIYQEVIKEISDGSCLFIYFPDDEFLKKSTVLTMTTPLNPQPDRGVCGGQACFNRPPHLQL
jgi:hypothetical protein